jgi:hypothetical protein
MIEDRSMKIEPGSVVNTAWVPIDDCVLGCRERMDVAAVERAFRKYLQVGDCQFWPPIIGHWNGPRFVVCDGRHELLALLALGREHVFVGWIDKDDTGPRVFNLTINAMDSASLAEYLRSNSGVLADSISAQLT